MVNVGYGISDLDYNDYKGIENAINGNAVVVLDGAPGFITGKKDDDLELLFNKIKTAQDFGAKALIICSLSKQNENYDPYLAYVSRVPESLKSKIERKKQNNAFTSLDIELSGLTSKTITPPFDITIPVILIQKNGEDHEIIEKYLGINKTREKINKTMKPCSKLIKGLNIVLNIDFKKKMIRAINIIGFLEGNETKLKDRIIVLGAHYDHLGKNEKGEIFSGADDNASGVAALLEIAGSLSKMREQLKRSVLFVAFGAEEWGLIGSQYFVNNPVFSGKKVVNMVNIDSIGKGSGTNVWFVGSSHYPELATIPGKYLAEYGLKEGENIDKYAFAYGSDHYPFHSKNIPAIDVFSTNYRELHKITDTFDKINESNVTNICKTIYMAVLDLATR